MNDLDCQDTHLMVATSSILPIRRRNLVRFTTHVPVQDTHEVAPEIPNLAPWNTGQFINRKEGILLTQHPNLRLDLLIHFLLSTKAI